MVHSQEPKLVFMEELDLAAIGDRIRSVRGMLRQVDFADRLGVERKTIGRYEAGERPPDAVVLLRLMSDFGINPIWVLTGRGSNRVLTPDLATEGNAATSRHLAPKEQVILDAYRSGTAEQQEFILAAALGFAGTGPAPGRSRARVREKSKKGSVNMTFEGEVGQVSHGNINNEAGVSFNVGRKKGGD